MAAPATAEEFLDLVRKSGVSDEKRLEPHVQRMRQGGAIPREPGKLAGLLVRDGYLTHFQAEQILQGKWRRFTVGKYKVLERLGSGGMGQVFLCEHKLMRRRVAVKVLPTAKAQDPSSLERFYREARAVAALDHPNIVHAYDIDQDETLHFLVMEYVDGSNLQDIVKKSGPMNILRACHYIRQSAQGLEHAHRAGLVHRDIKPGNILVDRSGTVKILDMGLARFFNDEEDILTKKYDENVLGTADYLAPEQALDSHGVDIRADIYSLGATFYYMLTGKTPFGEGTVAQKFIWHQTRHPKPVQEVRHDVPPGIVAVINKMMAKDPANRYQSPGEIAVALAPFTQTPIGPPPDAEMPHLSPAAAGATPVDTSPETVVRSGTQSSTPSIRPAAAATPTLTSGGAVTANPAPPTRAVPVAQPIQTAVAAEAGEEIHWEELDTQNLSRSDTAPSSRRRRTTTEKVFEQPVRRVWLVAIVCAVPVAVILGVLAWIFVFNAPTPAVKKEVTDEKEDVKREKLIVRKGAKLTKSTFPSLQAALIEARRGEVIELQDEEIAENLVLDGALSRPAPDVTIQAAAGKSVRWKSGSSDPKDPIIRVLRGDGLALKSAGIVFDGDMGGKRVRDLIVVQGECPRLLVQNVHFKNFGRSAISFVNAVGAEKEPIRVQGVLFHGPGAEPDGAAIMIGADHNDHITIQDDCTFLGYPSAAKAISITSAAAGKNIELPKK